MTNDAFERIKEAEKARLRSQQRLKAALDRLHRHRAIEAAVTRLTTGAAHALRQHAACVADLDAHTARTEARLAVALGGPDPHADDDLAAEAERRAAELVRQYKHELGVLAPPPSAAEAREGPRPADSPPADAPHDGPRAARPPAPPEKTIGRMCR
jgi:hypothetical protein